MLALKVTHKIIFFFIDLKGMRYIFTLMGFFGYFTVYAIRVNINVAIVAMVNNTAVYKPVVHHNETTSGECKVDPPPLFLNDTVYVPPDVSTLFLNF